MTRQLRHHSPLRYPGGKARLAPFIARLFEENALCDGHYAEAYAGGAGIALSLLNTEHARVVHINDVDGGVYAFWHCVLERTEELCKRVADTPATVEEWHYQKAFQSRDASVDPLDLGFSTFFLNRTNRSGIITGGMIGGVKQLGRWTLDARLNRLDLVRRIQRVAAFRDRIRLTNLDAIDFLGHIASMLLPRALTYCDPPYFVKGQQRLYTNYYHAEDHEAVAMTLQMLPTPWVVSYDRADEILALYRAQQRIEYDFNYSAADRYRGTEVMFFSPDIRVPAVGNPAYLQSRRRPGGYAKAKSA